MIIGIGTDIVEIKRIRDIDHLERFVQRILTSSEFDKYKQYNSEARRFQYLAGRFAAKEAFSKALGTGIGDVSFQDIEILNDSRGKPYVKTNLSYRTHITISHSNEYAIAYVILEGNEK